MKVFSPVYREIPFESPHIVYEKLGGDRTILLESAGGPAAISRYSFLCFQPWLGYKVKDGLVEIEFSGRRTLSSRHPLARLRELISAYRQRSVPSLPPFQGGAAGIFSYDFVRYFEKMPSMCTDDLSFPDAHFFLFDRLISFDHLQKKSWIVVCPAAREAGLGFAGVNSSEEESRRTAEAEIEAIWGRISGPPVSRKKDEKAARIRIVQDTARVRYIEMVKRAKEYIAAGDIFQANLSLRISAELEGRDPWTLYTRLREVNPSPFSAFMNCGGYAIASSSPERLARVVGNEIDTRPIAGTRPRGSSAHQDESLRAELLLSEKERAEHIMLIDLERNDLGRVCDYGSIGVDELMVTEAYSHVMHIVSNVKGTLAQGKDCFSAIRAAFPGGTITGVPKVRCMEIIEELEEFRRGPYTGSIGYIGHNGNMDLNIVIRTFLIKNGKAYIQAGAGIVADSEPEKEYNESLKKAEALIRTLELI